MCGIVGWVSCDQKVERSVIQTMNDLQSHRGPDGEGVWISSDHRVGFGHRRLSIIDLATTAAQPMVDREERATLVFNGEIYNHRALRQQLEKVGRVFHTDHSDTETILQGFLEWGIEGLLDRLIGMFAFVIYDRENEKIFMVRDRLGIKPLYFSRLGRQILFASEIKSMFAHPDLKPRLDKEVFYHYLAFRSVAAPHSLFESVEKLSAGEMLVLDIGTGSTKRRRYWEPLASRPELPESLDDAREQLDALLTSSLTYRMEADVPVGVFLSGGVDSAFLLHKAAGEKGAMKTFTVTYPGQAAYDEGAMAKERAECAHTIHHEIPLDEDIFLKTLPAVAYYQDEPVAAPVCVPVFMLSREARQAGVPVVLTGEGSDEIFIGYDSWLQVRRLQKWNDRLPDLPGNLLRRMAARSIAAVTSSESRYTEFARRAVHNQPLFWGGAMDFTEESRKNLVGPAVRVPEQSSYDAFIRPIREDFERYRPSNDVSTWMSYLDVRFRLPELMLPRLDKMGMAFSIEARVPFLDHRVVELALNLPMAIREANPRQGKALFKETAARYLPHDFVYRRKQGFQAPVKEWGATAFGRYYKPRLLEFARRTELFDVTWLTKMLQHPGDRLYFSLTNFMLWYLIFIENVLPDMCGYLDQRSWVSHPDHIIEV